MLVSQILTDVRNQLKETAPAFWTNEELVRLINRGIQDFANRTRMLQDKTMLSLEEGRSSYPLPNNWISTRLVMHKQVVDGVDNWRRVQPTNLEKITQENPAFMDQTQTDRPAQYFIWGSDIYVIPAPNAANCSDSDLVMFYVSTPIPIISESQDLGLDDSLADGITAFVLWKAWMKEEETERANDQRDMYFEYVKQGLRFVKRKIGDERKMIDIDSPIGFRQNRNPFDPLS